MLNQRSRMNEKLLLKTVENCQKQEHGHCFSRTSPTLPSARQSAEVLRILKKIIFTGQFSPVPLVIYIP